MLYEIIETIQSGRRRRVVEYVSMLPVWINRTHVINRDRTKIERTRQYLENSTPDSQFTIHPVEPTKD